ncbi:carbohydrate kinase [Sphingomonas ginkgonis]|uniref:Carbohydrate kinase n=2 Tax=Sphingomonas ginkgonis TaxID=2315330 RepID=A0A429VDS2_9SPHN|nr:carbohydrate kinase [Sphingomonas ginkgonis]
MSKLTLWSAGGNLLARETRPNARVAGLGFEALDAGGIEEWLLETLAAFARLAPDIGHILPVAHGAAAAIVRDGRLLLPPLDYEEPVPADERRAYDRDRDGFERTGSPALPHGLNLGAQLHHLEARQPGVLEGAQILLWPQYWAWLLSGVAASEVTSLGCHSDLWHPVEERASELAVRRGWAGRLPPLRRAGEVLGPLRPELARRLGLTADLQVHAGLHDSNAALVAARAFPEIAERESTVLSTGTWFVAMRTPAPGTQVDIAALPEARDCLVNVDAFGRPVPSARFMGGREIETLTGIDTRRIDIRPDQPSLVAALPSVLASGAMVLPTFAGGVGPFPNARGRWVGMPADQAERRAAVSLYAALVAEVALGLIGTRERILVEGRFAEAEVFVRALATLRPDLAVYVANAHNDVSFGALRLLDPSLQPQSSLRRVEPLELDLTAYRSRWLAAAEQLEEAA